MKQHSGADSNKTDILPKYYMDWIGNCRINVTNNIFLNIFILKNLTIGNLQE